MTSRARVERPNTADEQFCFLFGEAAGPPLISRSRRGWEILILVHGEYIPLSLTDIVKEPRRIFLDFRFDPFLVILPSFLMSNARSSKLFTERLREFLHTKPVQARRGIDTDDGAFFCLSGTPCGIEHTYFSVTLNKIVIQNVWRTFKPCYHRK